MTPTVTRTVGVRGAGVFVDRLEARVLLRLSPTAG
jgi:hypothetical protein